MRLTEELPMGSYRAKTIYLEPNRNEQECVYKLGQLEDYEDDLGIDLITLSKAFKQGYIYLDIKENNKGISKIEKFGVGGILFDKEERVWRLTNDDKYDGAYWGSIATNKNYGKTWALTKEELELL